MLTVSLLYSHVFTIRLKTETEEGFGEKKVEKTGFSKCRWKQEIWKFSETRRKQELSSIFLGIPDTWGWFWSLYPLPILDTSTIGVWTIFRSTVFHWLEATACIWVFLRFYIKIVWKFKHKHQQPKYIPGNLIVGRLYGSGNLIDWIWLSFFYLVYFCHSIF